MDTDQKNADARYAAARQTRNRRRADILVRSKPRTPMRPACFSGRLRIGRCCGQECPRAGTACCLLAACQQSRLLQYCEHPPTGGRFVAELRSTEFEPLESVFICVHLWFSFA
jgi:hypothetical protein